MLKIPALDLSQVKKSKNFNIDDYADQWSTITVQGDEPWLILTPLQKRLKEKIEACGIPLKEWDISINYGIKTGFNEAFIINQAKRDELLAADPKSADMIKPILRGRDIRKYEAKWANLYIIMTHNGYKNQKEEKIPAIDINDYPIVKQHLDKYLPQLKKRLDKGKTPYNLRHCAYYKDFEKEKIIYSEIVQDPQFYLDSDKHFPEATAFFMVGESIKFLLAVLNSKSSHYFFKKFYAGGGLGERGVRYKKAFLETLPIPQLSRLEQKPFENLVDKILKAKVSGKDSIIYEEEIDRRVFELYGLTEEEIQLVENV